MDQSVTVCVCAHKPFVGAHTLPHGYLPLQVGAAGSPDLGFARDDVGENISAKNASYCELTGLYWMWKNITADVVGLCHYRRYLSHRPLDRKLRALLREEEITRILRRAEIILPRPVRLGRRSVWEHYAAAHYERDLALARDAVRALSPAYAKSFDAVMRAHKSYQCNMFIAPRALADEYCAWLFSVLSYVEARTDISDYDAVQRRVYGYLGERLLAVWVHGKGLRVCHKWYASTELGAKDVWRVLRDRWRR